MRVSFGPAMSLHRSQLLHNEDKLRFAALVHVNTLGVRARGEWGGRSGRGGCTPSEGVHALHLARKGQDAGVVPCSCDPWKIPVIARSSALSAGMSSGFSAA